MIKPQTLAEQLLFSTARIEAHSDDGRMSVGTGFFFKVKPATRPDLQLTLLITNKHVVAGHQSFRTVLHTEDANGNPAGKKEIRISTTLGTGWIGHDDPKIDLCALSLENLFAAMAPNKIFYRSIEPENMLLDEKLADLDAIEDVVMYGYPNGLWDEPNNLPLIRRGVTASHPALDYLVDDVATTVVDMACFPGSSGSPVFIFNNGSFSNKTSEISLGQRLIFLGALFAGPQILNDGQIVIKDIPTVAQPVAVTPAMMNLGYVIKARHVLSLATTILARIPLPPAR